MLEQSAVARLGELALESSDPHKLMVVASEIVAQTLEVQYAGVLEISMSRVSLSSSTPATR